MHQRAETQLLPSLLLATALLIASSQAALCSGYLILRLEMSGDKLPTSIKVEDSQVGTTTIHQGKDFSYTIKRAIPKHGETAALFTVLIPWLEDEHALYFRVPSTRQAGIFALSIHLERLPTTLASIRKLERMNGGVQANVERLLLGRQLFFDGKAHLNKGHGITLAALRQWIEGSYKLATDSNNIFSFDNQASDEYSECRRLYGSRSRFLQVIPPQYISPLIGEGRTSAWRDAQAVRELREQGRFREALGVNDALLEVWRTKSPSERKLVTDYQGVTTHLLVENDKFLSSIVGGHF